MAGLCQDENKSYPVDFLYPKTKYVVLLTNQPLAVNGKHLEVYLAPGGGVRLALGMKRYCNKPSYEQPA